MPDWPRPDFNAAAMELLIGIAALSMQPKYVDVWKEGLTDGPIARLRFRQEHGVIAAKKRAATVEAPLLKCP